MDLGNRLEVDTLAEHTFAYRLSLPVPTHQGGWLVSFQDNPEVIILDERLNEIDRVDLQANTQEYCSTSVALDRSGDLFAVSARTELRICNRRGKILHEFPHTPWDSFSFSGSNCFFDLENRLWYVWAGDDPYRQDYCLRVVDPTSGTSLFECNFDGEVGHFDLFPSPSYEDVLVDVACGQDGCFLHIARLTAPGLVMEQFPWDDRTFCGGFSPNGKEFVTGAHHGDRLEVHDLLTGRAVAAIDSEMIFGRAQPIRDVDQDAVGYQAFFLGDRHILVESQFGRMMLFHRPDLRLLGTVWPTGGRLYGFDREGKETNDPNAILGFGGGPTSFHPAGAGRLLSVYKERTLKLLDLSSALTLS